MALLWMVLALACRPSPAAPEGLDDPPVPDAEVVARLDPAGVPPWSQGPPRAEPLAPAIVSDGPHGDVPNQAQIFLRFNQAMKPPAEGAPPIVRLEPAVPGTIRWTDAYQLTWSPDRVLAAGQSYSVIVEGALETIDGRPMELDRRWAIAVGRTVVDLFMLHDEDYPLHVGDGAAPIAHWKSRFLVVVDRPADSSTLRASMVVEGQPASDPKAEPRRLEFELRRPTRRERKHWASWFYDERSIFVVQPRDHWPADTRVGVRVEAGFRGQDDTLGLDAPEVARLVTPPGLGIELDCELQYDDGCDPGPVYVRLDHAITSTQVAKIRVAPRPAALEIEGHDTYGDGITEVSINGEFQPGQRYTVTVGAGLHDVHGQPPIEEFRREVSFVMPPPALSLAAPRGFLPADRPRTIGIESRSLRRARLRVAVLDDAAAVARAAIGVDEGMFPREGATVIEQELDLDPAGTFEWSSIALDLATFTKGERRPVFVEVEPLELTAAAAGRTMPEVARGLYQVTDLGVFAMLSSANSLARVTRLSSADPVPDAKVQLYRASASGPAEPIGEASRTDAQGLAPLPTTAVIPRTHGVLLVRSPADDDRFVMGPQRVHGPSESPGVGFAPGESVLTSVVTERPLYRPGETIHVVGWATVSTPHTASGLRPVPKGTEVEIVLRDRADDVTLRRTVRIKEYGKYWAKLRLPDDLRLGYYAVQATVGGTTATAHLRLRRFRTPSFAVDAAVDQGDVRHGAAPQVTVGASYYFGGRVPIVSARRDDQCYGTSFRPPGLEPHWIVGGSPTEFPDLGRSRRVIAPEPEQPGRLRYTIDLSQLDTSWAYRCTSAVAVQDAAAAEVGAETSFMVHPSRYLLLGSPTGRLEEGDAIELPARATDHRAERIAGVPVKLRVTRTFWKQDADGAWHEHDRQLPECTLETTATGRDPVCRLSKLARGYYEIEASTTDGGPKAVVALSLWVGGRWRPHRTAAVATLEVDVSDPEPRPGDTVTVTVTSPRATGQGVLALMHGGLRTVEPFELRAGRYEHRFTVVDDWVPRIDVEAVVVHPATTKHESLLQRASGSMRVTAEHRVLSVEVTSPDVSGPGQTIPIEVTLRDAAGEPVAGHVALWAVDEAVLSLAEPVIPDLVAAFATDRGPETDLHHDYAQRLFPYVVRSDPYEFGWHGRGEGRSSGRSGSGYGRGGGSGTGVGESSARRHFDTTPIFLGDLAVGPSGRATTKGTLPDDLTTFRITAIASAELVGGDAIGRFGHADSRVRVTSPLVVQAVLPRHLRPGDEAELGALVDNLGGPAGLVTVVAGVDDPHGAVQLSSATTVVQRVEAGAQIRVPFRLRARGEGEPRVTITATLAAERGDVRLSDSIELPVPVKLERSVTREVAVYGSLADDGAAAIALVRPEAAQPGAGGVDVALSSTLLGGAEDLVQGLVGYPYGCVEQTSSRLLPLAALGELAKHYPLGVDDLDRFVRVGVARLQTMEVADGGLGYWPGDTTSHAYATAYAAWVLQQLDDAGYTVPRRFLTQLRTYLGEQVDDWASHGTPTVEDDVRLAMALHALAAGGAVPAEALAQIYERRRRLPLFAQAIVTLALFDRDHDDPRVSTMTDELLADLDERDGFAHVRDGGRWYGALFDSGPRTEAMVLLALLHAAPADRRVEKLARGMLELRRSGAMRNTQERAYALLALAQYARRFEAEVPAFDGRAWVGRELIGRTRFEGRGADVRALGVPLPWTDDPTPGPHDARVTLSRRGQGRMYYRVAMRWVPEQSTLEPHAAGIAVERTLRVADGPVSSRRPIHHGELVALDLVVTTNDTLDYVAIDVPLPAGLEAVDTTIGKGRRAMVLHGDDGWWVSHTELETDRSLVFADRLPPGKHRHTVFLRAITPGTYTMPPTKAEAMYYPEIQGYTGATRVEVVR